MPDVRLIDANAIDVGDISCSYGENCKLEDVQELIDDQPTVDAQPVKNGKWEWEPGYVGTTAKCSVCGLSPRGFYSLPISQIGRLPEYKFCPNCGAKMDGGDAK